MSFVLITKKVLKSNHEIIFILIIIDNNQELRKKMVNPQVDLINHERDNIKFLLFI